MKKLIITLMAALSLIISLYAYMKPVQAPVSRDKRGHELVQLWKQYDEARAKDRPALQTDLLQSIIAQSKERGLVWDYYDAWRNYINVSSIRNWKLRDSLESAFAKDLETFAEPVATISWYRDNGLWSASELLGYISANADRLKRSRNDAFYDNVGRVSNLLSNHLPEYLSNDYEYVLWSVASFWDDDDKAVELLREYLHNTYPNAAYLEYMVADSKPEKDRKTALEQIADSNRGNAVGYYAQGALLSIRKFELDMKKGSQDEYKSLYEEMSLFEKARKAVGGKDAELLKDYTEVSYLIKHLESPEIRIAVKDGSVRVYTRNVSTLNLKIAETSEKKAFFSKTLVNEIRSFYVYDTLSTTLPSVDDGQYRIEAESGRAADEQLYSKYSFSVAARRDKENYSIYLAEQQSGEPVERANLSLYKNGSVVAKCTDFAFNGGFTALPSEISSKIKSGSTYWLEAWYTGTGNLVKRSRRISLSTNYDSFNHSVGDGKYCNIYTDRSAYNPGDTVQFKAVLFEGNLMNEIKASDSLLPVEVVLKDSEGVERSKLKLISNEFGSVAGQFEIEKGLRNGRFSIELSGGGFSGSKWFRVDEFVLPEFDLEFESDNRFYVPGDSVEVRGRLFSYSGHTINSADLSFAVNNEEENGGFNKLETRPDGTFSIIFPTDSTRNWQYCNVTVKVVADNGETREFSTGVLVARNFRLAMDVTNKVQAQFQSISDTQQWRHESIVIEDDHIDLNIFAVNNEDDRIQSNIKYGLYDENGKLLFNSVAPDDGKFSIDLSGFNLSYYTLKAETELKGVKAEESLDFVRLSKNAKTLDAPLSHYFRAVDTEIDDGAKMEIQFATADGPIWAVLELFGASRQLLRQELIHLEGKRAEPGSLASIYLEYDDSYPDAVYCQLFYFKKSESRTFNCQFNRVKHELDLPLRWLRFEDRTFPGTRYQFELETDTDVEILAGIYDKSTDEIEANIWNKVKLTQFRVPSVYISSVAGGEDSPVYTVLKEAVMGVKTSSRVLKSAKAMNTMDLAEPMAYDMVTESETVYEDGAPIAAMGEEGNGEIKVRENFAKTLAFEPFLRSDENGRATLDFTTSDKLSTFKVVLYAHDKQMRNALLTKEMLVTIPVKLSVLQPGYLYLEDKYDMSVSLSSMSDEAISGTLYMYQYDGKEHEGVKARKVKSRKLTIEPKSEVSHSFELSIPENVSELGVKIVFEAEQNGSASFSDAMFFSIPVYPMTQTMTESHSLVILPGMDSEAELEKLRSSFVNVSAYGALHEEKSIMDMLRSSLPAMMEPKSDDLLSLSEAYYVRRVAETLSDKLQYSLSNEKLLDRIMACRNADGGFAWFEGMNSSAVMTSIILERFSKLSALGYETPDLSASVRYMDYAYFSTQNPIWGGGISMEQYLYIRTLYASVPFEYKPVSASDERYFKDFRKSLNAYLLPKKERMLNGQIFAKARRLRILSNFLSVEGGLDLAKSWGLSFGAAGKLHSSMSSDVVSLLEYAVSHKSGGIYYPNAVMPYRGLLESEAYAHSVMADLFSDYAGGFGNGIKAEMASEAEAIAKGIRIWLMVQKETQQWDAEPAYLDAIHSVLSHPEGLEDVKVLILSKTYEKPFSDINSYGNGFRLDRKVFKDGREIREGEMLKVGDRITVQYNVWNEENRSFVVLRAPREASLRPVNQLSGLYGPSVRPLYSGGLRTLSTIGYRNVKTSVSEFYYDSYPEENTTIVEDFYVTQAGEFVAPVVEILSVYADHYRANSGSSHGMSVASVKN